MNKEKERRLQVWLWLMITIIALLMISCGSVKYVPVNRVQYVTETLRDTVVEVVTPAERVVTVVPDDTVSRLSTTYATSVAEVRDGCLYHSIEQPPRRDSLPTKMVLIHQVDSVPYPVEVEVEKRVIPQWSWWTLAVSLLFAISILYRYIKR